MSSSHLLGLPIALLVLHLELNSGFHSAAFFSHLSLGDVAIPNANFHFFFLCVLFQHRIFALSVFSMASSVLLFYVFNPIFFFNQCGINLIVVIVIK